MMPTPDIDPTLAPFPGLDEPADRHFLGLDLGQSQDPSALVALRRRRVVNPRCPEDTLFHYTVRGIKSWPLGTSYPQIVADVVKLVSQPPLAGCMLGIDKTGCGAPVVDMFLQARPSALIRPILITGGHSVTGDERSLHLPKVELVSAVNAVLQGARLDIPADLPQAAMLAKELLSFRTKISTSGHESYEADWRTRAHDDIVLALAMAVWLGEHTMNSYSGPLVFNSWAPWDGEEPKEDPDAVPAGYTRLCGHLVRIEDPD